MANLFTMSDDDYLFRCLGNLKEQPEIDSLFSESKGEMLEKNDSEVKSPKHDFFESHSQLNQSPSLSQTNQGQPQADQNPHAVKSEPKKEKPIQKSKGLPRRKKQSKAEKALKIQLGSLKSTPTHNLLPFAKKSHEIFIAKRKGEEGIEMLEEHGIDMDKVNLDYFSQIYKIKELQSVFQKYFDEEILLKDLENSSKINPKNKQVWKPLLFNFPKAFKNKEFKRIEDPKRDGIEVQKF